MKKELDYFQVEHLYGGCQDWFTDPMMKMGGCAAIAACESCIYFDLHYGTKLYPFEKNRLGRKDYIDRMKGCLSENRHGKRMILCLCVAEKNGYIIY